MEVAYQLMTHEILTAEFIFVNSGYTRNPCRVWTAVSSWAAVTWVVTTWIQKGWETHGSVGIRWGADRLFLRYPEMFRKGKFHQDIPKMLL